MLNTTPQTAPKGALHDTPQLDFAHLFGEFARFMQKEQYNIQSPFRFAKRYILQLFRTSFCKYYPKG